MPSTSPSHALRRRALGALGATVLVAVVLGRSAPVAAQDAQDAPGSTATSTTSPPAVDAGDAGCTDVLHDPEGALGEAPALAPAAVQLVAAGIDLHVRVVDRLPSAEDVAARTDDCPSWLADGRRPARAMWLFVAPDATTTGSLWYGEDLRSRIGSRFAELRDRHLDPSSTIDGASVAAVLDELRALVAAVAPPVDPFGCEQLLWDPNDQLEGSAAEDEAFALQGGGGEVHVRVEPPADGDIDRRIEQLDDVCGWGDGSGGRPDRQLVVIVQPSQRSTGIWYGTWWDDRLEGRWEDIQEREMNPEFRRGDYDGGLAAGLQALDGDRRTSPGFTPYDPFDLDGSDGDGYGSYDSGSSSGSTFPWGPIVLVFLFAAVAWGLQYASWRSKVDSGETDLSFGQYTSERGGSSRRSSYRSSRSSSGGGSRRSSSGGGRRSSGGGRRSGGGSTRW